MDARSNMAVETKRSQQRTAAEGYFMQVLVINDEPVHDESHKSCYIENICKGGFRFQSDMEFELEDRIKVLLRFPDEHTQEVLGRICYSDDIGNGRVAYGFSIISGFYALPKV